MMRRGRCEFSDWWTRVQKPVRCVLRRQIDADASSLNRPLDPMHTEGVVARCWASDPWRNKLAHLLSICGMHTSRDSTRGSRYTTRWFSTCANILLYAHRERSDLRGVNDAFGVFRALQWRNPIYSAFFEMLSLLIFLNIVLFPSS